MVRALAGVFLIVLATMSAAHAEQRLALLIGNQSYAAKVGPLQNPRQDVALIEASLKRLGFEVTVLTDADYRNMDVAVKRYVSSLRHAGPGAVGFFYYSGHGASNPETQINYLIPVDVANAEDETVWFQSFAQNQLIDLFSTQAPDATQFVVFDACRKELNLSSGAVKGLGTDKGFVPVANTAGLLIAYATAPNRTASDAGDGGGPYAKALAEELLKPGVEAVTMFRNVQIRVKQAIGQDPWLSFPSLAAVYLAGRGPAEAAKPQVPDADAEAGAAREWAAVDKGSIAMLQAFLQSHGASSFGAAAKARLDELTKTAAITPGSAAPASAGAAAPETCEGGLLIPVAVGKSPCIKPGSGGSFRDCPECPEMVVAPSGSFTMGSPAGEPGRETSEGPQHQVAIAEPFAVGRFTVTRGEYETFVRETNHPMDKGCFTWVGSWKFDSGKDYHAPGFPQSDGHPVVCVNWDDAKAYAAWLSQKTGKNYRLLTEAEFEYVARAGTRTPFWWGTSLTAERANYHATMVYAGGGKPGDYRAGTVLAKTFAPNPWGLYQVHGNALEWVEDCWNDTYNGAPADGSANETGDCGKRGVRGGCWICYPQYLRSARRGGRASGARGNNFGIRVARSIAP